MLKEDIGFNAGTIWHLLSEKGTLSLIELEELTGYKKDLILFALGWLARENKIEFSDRGGTISVRLTSFPSDIFYS